MGALVFCNIYGFRIRIGAATSDRNAVNINSYDPSFNVINPIDDVFLFKNESGKTDLYNVLKYVCCPVRFIKGNEGGDDIDDSLGLYFRFNSSDGGVRMVIHYLFNGDDLTNTIDSVSTNTNGFENNATYITSGTNFSWVAK